MTFKNKIFRILDPWSSFHHLFSFMKGRHGNWLFLFYSPGSLLKFSCLQYFQRFDPIFFSLSSSLLILGNSKMPDDKKCSLKRKYFTKNVSSILRNDNFCDVTLVSDDQKQFQAHRYVLGTFSPVLNNILLNNLHSHPLIYLRGVNHQDKNATGFGLACTS